MTCREYRERLRGETGSSASSMADDDLRAHAAGCPGCAQFTQWLMALDRALRDLPRAPIPGPVIDAVRDIALRPPPLPWRPDLLRAAVFIIPAVFVWTGRTLLPDAFQFLAPATLAFAGAFIFVTAALRPRLLGSLR